MQLWVKDKHFYSSLLLIALPVVLQNMITIGVTVMDVYMVGKLGEVSLSASSLAGNYLDLFIVLNLGIGGGAGVFIAQYWGNRDMDSIKKMIVIMSIICFSFASVFALLAITVPAGIMKIYTNDSGVIEAGRIYLLWSTPTFFVHGLVMVLTLSLRSMGKVLVPFISTVVSFFVNIFFNWVFIFGNLGAPRLEIAGAALGTVLSRVVEALIIGRYFFHGEKHLKFRIRDFSISPKGLWRPFMKSGTPVIASDSFIALGNNMISVIMGHIGTAFVAAYAIVFPVMRLCNVASIGLATAAAAIIGKTIGEGRSEESQTQGYTCLILTFFTGLVAAALVLFFCPRIVNAYNLSEEAHEIARQLVYAVSIIIIFQATQCVLNKGILRGGADTRFAMVSELLFMWTISIPFGAISAFSWGCSPLVIYLIMKCDQFLKSCFSFWRFQSRKWVHEVYDDVGKKENICLEVKDD